MTESLNRIPGKTARWMWKIFTCMNLSHFPLFMCLNRISVSFVLYILRNQPIGWAKRIMNKTVFANSILLVENSVGWMTVNLYDFPFRENSQKSYWLKKHWFKKCKRKPKLCKLVKVLSGVKTDVNVSQLFPLRKKPRVSLGVDRRFILTGGV